jgi:hypothetical protein
MDLKEGIYEAIITEQINGKLKDVSLSDFYVETDELPKEDAAGILSRYLGRRIFHAMDRFGGDHQIENQVRLANNGVHYSNQVT